MTYLDSDIDRIADHLADRFLGERLPIDFGGIPSGHKVQLFHLKRMAKAMLADDGNPSSAFMPPSPIRMVAIAMYDRAMKG